MVNIVKACIEADFIKVEALANTIWRAHYIPIVGKPQIDYMLTEFQSSQAIKKQVNAGYAYYLLNYQQQEVGYLAIKQDPEALFLSKIYILKQFRRMGIGQEAMTFVIDKAKVHNLSKIRLTVNINNKASIAAYEKLGFKNEGALVTDIGHGFIMDDFEMVKEINPQ